MASTTQHVQAAPEGNAAGIKGAYWLSSNAGDFPSSEIKTSVFTHIYYASLIPNEDTCRLELSPSDRQLLSNFISGIPNEPRVKTLISIGGTSDAAGLILANMASTADNRKAFIDSSIQVARTFGFDGLELDWEFPKNPKEMEDYGQFLEEWHDAVAVEADAMDNPRLLLTAKVYFTPTISFDSIQRSYPAPIMAQNLDWINAMCYNYYSATDQKTGAPAAFFDLYSDINSFYGHQSWVQSGMPVNKFIMGLPLYGITWQLKHPKVYGIGAPAVGPGPGNGTLPYSEIKELFHRENNAMVLYDQSTISNYSHFGVFWVGYDDVESTKQKIKLAHALKASRIFRFGSRSGQQRLGNLDCSLNSLG